MFIQNSYTLQLQERRIRQAFAVRIGSVIALFFSAAWCLLQWTLATEERFMAPGLPRQFVEMEAFFCAAVAFAAAVVVVTSAAAWMYTGFAVRREASPARMAADPRLNAFV